MVYVYVLGVVRQARYSNLDTHAISDLKMSRRGDCLGGATAGFCDEIAIKSQVMDGTIVLLSTGSQDGCSHLLEASDSVGRLQPDLGGE